MSVACDRCKWCVARGCNEHEDQTGPYVPPPRLAPPEPSDPLTALAEAIDGHFDSCLRSHRDPAGVREFADAILAALAASGYTLVPAERLARLERIEAAARALYAPETDRHPRYGEDARDGHAPGSWPWDECPKCNANRTARHSALRAALAATEGEDRPTGLQRPRTAPEPPVAPVDPDAGIAAGRPGERDARDFWPVSHEEGE
jgi:hypothetical protein